MARRQKLKLWYDTEGDYLEVLFSDEPGTFEETGHERVMVRLNERDEVTGFSILGLSKLDSGQLDLLLEPLKEHI